MKTIIEMAREAGVEVTYDPTETPTRAFAECWLEDLERLVDLVRADEREACAKVCEARGVQFYSYSEVAKECYSLAAVIRARGNA